MPTEKSFKVQPAGANDMSWNWLEFLNIERKAAISKLRKETGAMTPDPGSCYAVAVVEQLKDVIKSIPGKDFGDPKVIHSPQQHNESHASVFSDEYRIGDKVVRVALADMMTGKDIEPGIEP